MASRKADKKHGEPDQVKVEDASAEAAILRMMGPRLEKERVAEGEADDASLLLQLQQAPPPAAAAAPSQAPAAGASPAKQAKNRDMHTAFFTAMRQFSHGVSNRAFSFLRSDFQFSVGPTVRSYTTNVPTL